LNTVTTIKEQEAEIERIVSTLTAMERTHLRNIIYGLVKCYEDDTDDCAVLIVGTKDSVENVVTIGCDTMGAAQMMLGANDFIGYLNTLDAPPKDMFN
jgi:hypothetical protein